MTKIKSIKAREILDSRGNPTVEVELFTNNGSFLASVPSGASKGKYEAPTVDVKTAVNNVNKIIGPKLRGMDPYKQKEIDELMKKLNVGANAVVGVSVAVCRAGAINQNLPLYKYIAKIYGDPVSVNFIRLPIPCFNIINGGVHASNDLDFQEFMIVVQSKTFSEAVWIASKIYQNLRQKLGINVGDEGGFAPNLSTTEQALDLIIKIIKTFGYQDKIKIALDVAASQFYKNKKYKGKTSLEMIEYYLKLIKKYPTISSIEDPFYEDDFSGFSNLMEKCGNKINIIGDDLLVTNVERIKLAKEKNLCNGLLLKINQIGTVSEAIEAAKLAKTYNWKIMVSHRSGETNDDFIADLAVGIGADYIKSGAPARGERVAKYNRLLKIEQDL